MNFKRNFKFLDMAYKRSSLRSHYISLICHHPGTLFPQNFNHLINISDDVVLADSGANAYLQYLNMNRKKKWPAMIVGDMDSIRKESTEFFEANQVPFYEDSGQDTNDFEKALVEIKERIIKPNTRENIIFKLMIWGLAGNRLDQLL